MWEFAKQEQPLALTFLTSDSSCNPWLRDMKYVQGGSNMTGTDLYVNKPHFAAAVRP